MYDKYFTKEEQRRIPFFKGAENSTADEWAAMVQSVEEAMAMKIPSHSPGAQKLAKRWMAMVLRDTQGDARILARLNAMHFNEPAVQAQTGVTPEVMRFIQEAFAETKFAIYEKYLSPDEFRFLRENYFKRTHEYPELIAAIRQHMEDGVAPDDPRMRLLARHWLELFRSYAGDNPETHAKIREANAKEPELRDGTWIDQRLLGYVIEAMSHLRPH